MKRRKALSTLSLISGGTLILPNVVLTGCENNSSVPGLFKTGDTELLNEIAETILPATPEIPGAKAANVGDFIRNHVTNCFNLENQNSFLEGFKTFKEDIKAQFGTGFISLNDLQRKSVLQNLESERNRSFEQSSPDSLPNFYNLLKNMVLFGYFTSEIGATKALRYLPIPGYQKGEIPYNGETAWAL